MTFSRCFALASTLALISGFAQAPAPKPAKPAQTFPAELVTAGRTLLFQQCAFCHGKDTGNGEWAGLTRSKLVAEDANRNQIGRWFGTGAIYALHRHRSRAGCARAFIPVKPSPNHKREAARVDPRILRRAISIRKQYFNGTGKCSSCPPDGETLPAWRPAMGLDRAPDVSRGAKVNDRYPALRRTSAARGLTWTIAPRC